MICEEMSLLYFGLDVIRQFEAGVPEFDAVFSVHCTRGGGGGVYPQILGLSKTASPKYNYDISLRISQYVISAINYVTLVILNTYIRHYIFIDEPHS